MLNKLYPMFEASVLMNKEAIQDESVMNALQSLSEDNFKFKPIYGDHYYISDRD